jgi:hypothetical protein
MESIMWHGTQESQFTVVADLWQEYIGERDSQPSDYLQRMHMLQEYIRKCMRHEHASYLAGGATAGRVSETKGHAILLGKIIANWERWLEAQKPLRVMAAENV